MNHIIVSFSLCSNINCMCSFFPRAEQCPTSRLAQGSTHLQPKNCRLWGEIDPVDPVSDSRPFKIYGIWAKEHLNIVKKKRQPSSLQRELIFEMHGYNWCEGYHLLDAAEIRSVQIWIWLRIWSYSYSTITGWWFGTFFIFPYIWE